jgi:ParB family chromosome partitioning protein
MAKKKDLGKGLRALLKDVDKSSGKPAKKAIQKLANSTLEIAVSSIETNPFQPRTDFDAEQLQELSDSIKLHGLVQPITVRSLGDGNFQLISGERRLRASKLAKLSTIPAYVRIANDQEMLEFALIENIQRQNLNAMEVAFSYQRLMDECSLTQDELSQRVGKKRSTVANYVRLLKLPPQIQQAVKQEEISMGHARVLAGIPHLVKQLDLFVKTKAGNWSVRKLEQEASAKRKPVSTKSNEHPEITKIKGKLSKLIGVKVNIKRSEKGAGNISIPFSSDEEFNDIIEALMD